LVASGAHTDLRRARDGIAPRRAARPALARRAATRGPADGARGARQREVHDAEVTLFAAPDRAGAADARAAGRALASERLPGRRGAGLRPPTEGDSARPVEARAVLPAAGVATSRNREAVPALP